MRRTWRRGATTLEAVSDAAVEASLTGEAKRRERLLLFLAHDAALGLFLVVVAEHVQYAVGGQVGHLAVDRVAVLVRLLDRSRIRDDDVAQMDGLTRRQRKFFTSHRCARPEICPTGARVAAWNGQYVRRHIDQRRGQHVRRRVEQRKGQDVRRRVDAAVLVIQRSNRVVAYQVDAQRPVAGGGQLAVHNGAYERGDARFVPLGI